MIRVMVVGAPLFEQTVVLRAGCEPLPVHFPGSVSAQVVRPPVEWGMPYVTVMVHCGPEGSRPAAGGRWTAGTRWFG